MNENFLDYFELTEEDLEKINDLSDLIDRLNKSEFKVKFCRRFIYTSDTGNKQLLEFDVGHISFEYITNLIKLIEYYYYKHYDAKMNINPDFHLKGNKLYFKYYYQGV